MIRWLLAVLWLVLAVPAAAATAEEIAAGLVKQQAARPPVAAELLPSGVCPAPPDLGRKGEALCESALDAATEAMRFNVEVHRYNANMYRRHQFWTEAAAVAVYLLTFSGLVFAGLQFFGFGKAGIRNSDVEIVGLAKISSPVIGLVILIISFGFFYLYVKDVYTIKPAGPAQHASG
ncbi:hypothetical protein [Sandarakinorhabdus sp. AAP62]|uniref:hypothetical protein n=1 Tax=Sandarakinorhabdus sp. AAP62 TaxID=1248916 RepID=UPI0002D86075|nr:hypothetical protein [Sandarakinorhabdus sp. AAP62]